MEEKKRDDSDTSYNDNYDNNDSFIWTLKGEDKKVKDSGGCNTYALPLQRTYSTSRVENDSYLALLKSRSLNNPATENYIRFTKEASTQDVSKYMQPNLKIKKFLRLYSPKRSISRQKE